MFIGDDIFIEIASPSVTCRLCRCPNCHIYFESEGVFFRWCMTADLWDPFAWVGLVACSKHCQTPNTFLFWFISLFFILSFQMQWKLVSLTSKERYQVGCETTCSHGFRYCKCIFFLGIRLHFTWFSEYWIVWGQPVRASYLNKELPIL